MRLAIDMQACLTDSRDRGIGRYADNLVAEMVRQRQDDEILLALDGADPMRLRQARSRLRHQCVRTATTVMHYPASAFVDHDALRMQSAARLRGRFFESLGLDAFLHTSYFETGGSYTTGIDWAADPLPKTAVIAYDVIPLLYPERYLTPHPFMADWYPRKCESFSRFDCFLSISQATRVDLIEKLGISPEKIHVINAGLDPGMLAIAQAGLPVDEAILMRRGIDAPFVLMVGNGDWRKNTLGALEAFARLPRSLQKKYLLVLTQVGTDVKEALAGSFSHLASRVRVLGRVDDVELVTLYQACRVFYFPSFYEGFGLPVLEAMAFGAPVLSANTGSLPEVVHDPRCLFDPHDIDAAASLLEAALEDATFREVLVSGVKAHAWTYNWKSCAETAFAALRALADDAKAVQPRFGKAGGFDRVRITQEDIDAWSGLLIDAPDAVGHLEQGLAAAAACGRRRILVDISEVVRLDARSGIQRVVRNYCAGLHALADDVGVEVQPVYWTEHGILYASDYAANRLGMPIETANAGMRVTVKPNDLLLMLDSSWWSPERFDALHTQVAAAGGEVVWMVYDLIPLLVPHTCDPVMPPVFRGWLEHAAATADGFICISEATRQDLERFLDERPAHLVARPWTRAMHLGSDLESGQIVGQASEAIASLLEGLEAKPLVLAVGTVEPRKDYATILAAFEKVWARGGNAALAIVGKHGWNVEELAQKLQAHPQLGTRLFWLQGVSDTDLHHLMDRADVLVQASVAEGFGLPLVEAGSRGKPLLLSDLAVFKEIAGEEASYFPIGDADALVAEIERGVANGWKVPTNIRTLTWRESSRGLIDKLLY
ncbi:glycosyltransferase family 4 protein [Xanthomonas vasicola]|uniref:glycosyltransferase family 4 protein n=1 Tax=Xanthomonas vasicola TaxID=56459 RepID=UPI000AB6A4E9|nr:glycosyltransferase family 1 protein [Xanthomonas vasicola]